MYLQVPEFLVTVLCLAVELPRNANAEAVFESGAGLSADGSKTDEEPRLMMREMLRLGDIGYHEWRAKYSRADVAVPIVFENTFADTYDEMDWTRGAFLKEFGELEIHVDEDCLGPNATIDDPKDCHKIRQVNGTLIGKKWAGLQAADLESFGIKTIGDLMRAQETPEGRGLYMHDESMTNYKPILDKVRASKYFPRDYKLINILERVRKVKDAAHFPSLFIAKKGSHSPLHADNHMTRFWVMQLSGKKHWRVFPPSEGWRLYPTSSKKKYYPLLFEANTMEPDFEKHPELNGALGYETVLNPGDMLIVPEAWSHQVYNLADSISMSANFVDEDCLQNHINFVKHNMQYQDEKAVRKAQRRLDIYESIFVPFDPPRPGVIDVNPKWDEFWRRHFMKRMPVPKHLDDWIEAGIDRPVDQKGYTALHQAARLNFVSAVEHLLEKGADPNVQANVEPFFTPLELAEDEENPEIIDLLKVKTPSAETGDEAGDETRDETGDETGDETVDETVEAVQTAEV